jgi:CRISPR-associated protein Cas2
MTKYVAVYDVSDDQQRSKIAKVLLQYGERLQKSVFIVDLEPGDFPGLRFAIGKHLSAEDEFDVIPIDDATNRVHLRWQADLDELEPVLIV